jgi:hypothetical protein
MTVKAAYIAVMSGSTINASLKLPSAQYDETPKQEQIEQMLFPKLGDNSTKNATSLCMASASPNWRKCEHQELVLFGCYPEVTTGHNSASRDFTTFYMQIDIRSQP